MDGVSVTLQGAETLARGLDALVARAGGDMTPAWADVGALLRAATDRRFDDLSADPDGNPWPPSIRALTEGHTLKDRGHLRDSITYAPGPDQVTQGSNRAYARIHQLGGVIKPKSGEYLRFTIGETVHMVRQVTMPARPYLGVTDADVAQAGDILAKWITRATA
ncbi:virion morphogenesis protein [Pararhodospirillum oryzae]|uniref:Virion morphogenesis protein n=2 Tax=Pararhodospirillum oryzae TaxID=478448 RepID=A0A512H9Z1_9PROT|nr:virion morphogenesis protein [Pararhodospirillum oryzae]